MVDRSSLLPSDQLPVSAQSFELNEPHAMNGDTIFSSRTRDRYIRQRA